MSWAKTLFARVKRRLVASNEAQSNPHTLSPITNEKGVRFHGSWYRGRHTNFIPSKADLRAPNSLEEYVLKGWLPPQPFIRKSDAIVAFGSCFAANISSFLADRGYTVSGSQLDHTSDSHLVRFGEGMVNTFSIRQQLEWALDNKDFPQDLWFGPDKQIASTDESVRASTRDIVINGDVFIITLGLSEIWYNKQTGDAFWRAIPQSIFDEKLHGFRVSSPEENLENLRAIYDAIRRNRPLAHIIFTLSPIPLMATFRPISCLTANSVSKAILRVAVDQFMSERQAHDSRVFYYPSYEIVEDVFPDARMEDNRHLKPKVIAQVMETFVTHYCVRKLP